MSRYTILAFLLALPLIFLIGCPTSPTDDDDSGGEDDDDVTDDDDSGTTDDDDVVDDDDSGATDDDDAVEPCADDALEDNDEEADAVAVTPPVDDLTACMDDDDWYSLDLLEGEWTVLLTFVDEEGDIDADLFDSAGDEVASGGSGSDNEELQVTVPAGGGTYLLQVYLFSDDDTPGNRYTITLVEYIAPVCDGDDAFEDNETEATAAAITAGSHTGLKVCAFDRDWYSIDLAEGDEITVEVLFTNDLGDIDTNLNDSNGIYVESGYSSDDNETMGPYTVPVGEAGTHTIDVHLYSDPDEIVGNVYDLNITVVGSGT